MHRPSAEIDQLSWKERLYSYSLIKFIISITYDPEMILYNDGYYNHYSVNIDYVLFKIIPPTTKLAIYL